ncbi:MAG: TolC family protein [Planctomycetota bacterium]|jgi:outer membrane protein TolC
MESRRIASLGGLLVASAFAGGCASLEATTDLERVADATRERLGRIPSAWETPDADESSPAWDGHGPLTPAVAVDTALRRSPQVVASRPSLAAARARFADAATPPNPVFRWMVGVPLDPVEAVPFLLGISQDLALLLERDVMEEIARHRLDAEILSIAEVVVSTAFEVRHGHARAVAAAAEVEIRRRLLDLADLRLAEVEDRLAIGEASPAERDEIAALAESAAASLAESARTHRAALLRLLHAMGCPELELDLDFVAGAAPSHAWTTGEGRSEDRPGDLARRLAKAVLADDHREEREAALGIDRRLVDVALRRRLDLLASDLETRARLAEIGLAERSVWRGLSLGVGVDRDMEGMRGVPFSGTVPLPIFDDGRIAESAALAAWRLALIERVALSQRIEFEVRDAWSDLEATLEILDRHRRRLADLDAVATSASERFDAGLGALESVRLAQHDRLLAELGVIDARLAVEIAQLDLRRSIGGDLAAPLLAASSKVAPPRKDPS